MNKKKRRRTMLFALALILASCRLDPEPPPDEETGKNPGNETPNETPAEDGKTYIEFQNHEDFPVKIYQDSSHFTLVAEVPAKGAVKVEASPNRTGVAFYPVFHLDIEGIPIVQSGAAVAVRVDEKKVNTVNIPPLESIATGFAYVKIENDSLYSLVFNQGGYELIPLGGASTIVMSGEIAAYELEPQAAQPFSFMRNASLPIPFPSGIERFERDAIYSFRYDGSVLALTSVTPLLPAPQNIVVAPGNGGITVRWDAVSLASSYNVYYSTGETPPETPAQTNIAGTTATISGLTNGAAYYVWVQAANSQGASPLSAPWSVTLPLYAATSQEFSAAIASINTSSEAKTHTITLTGSISAGGVAFTANAAKTVIIKGDGAVRAIANTGTADLFTVPSGVTLVLGNNLFLNGNDKSASAVSVDGGALVMNPGSRISAAKNSGIVIRNKGTFRMEGGEISGNTASLGGGVYVDSGTFAMKGGEISGNTASYTYGGGVYVSGGTFAMEGGEISGNTASLGGGVYVDSGTFAMKGGEISGNTSAAGGGVYDVSGGTFAMEGGAISGNTAPLGGGVYVDSGTFAMEGGAISGNTAFYGGGVYNNNGTFAMEGGEISGNTAPLGGGVYVGSGTFAMEGGKISGNTASGSYYSSSYGGGVYVGGTFTKRGSSTIDATNSADYGKVAYVYSGSKQRDAAAGPNVDLDSGKSGAAGGWE